MFQNFQDGCLEINEHDPTRFLTATGLQLQTVLKKTKLKLQPLTDIDGRKWYHRMSRYSSICRS